MRLTYFSLPPSHYLAVLRTLYLSSILLCISTIVLVWVRLRFYSFQIFFNSHWVVPTWRLIRLLPYSITESSNKVLGCFLFHQLCTFEKLCNLIRISKFHSWQTWEALHNKNNNNNNSLINVSYMFELFSCNNDFKHFSWNRGHTISENRWSTPSECK